jgi:hypothetical protein
MILLKHILLENEWPSIILNDRYTWYHGRTVDSETFSYDYVGGNDAIDQEGPGFYFTNNFENANRYALSNGIVLKCKINYKKLIIKSSTSNTLASKKIIVDLINSSPEKDYVLENFDENPKKAFITAVNVYLQNKYACDAYQTIANDFYKSDSKIYLQTLSKYYDGQLTPLTDNVTHLIVYNPNIITVIDKIKV